jgi:diketogulonate reductase-like aldo/keto reductase
MDEVYTLSDQTNMPKVGFGTWEITPDDAAAVAVRTALEAGYRHVDTARIYGNERGVGEGIRQSGVARDEIFVTTKLWNDDHDYDSAMQAFDASLQRLRLDYIDLYLVHWPGSDVLDGSWDAMQDILKAGKANAIGVSNYEIDQIEELLDGGGILPMVNQIELHPFNWTEQRELVEFCQEKGIVVEAYSPIKRLTRHGQETVERIAKDCGKSPSQVVLRWCLQHGTAPLPRSADPDHIRENIDIFDFELSSGDMQSIDALSE